MIHLLEHWLGLTNASGKTYLFWSGLAGDLPEFAILGVVYKRLNCHSSGCWRLGLHHVEGTAYVTCRKHHPVVPAGKVSAAHIHAAHRKAQGETK